MHSLLMEYPDNNKFYETTAQLVKDREPTASRHRVAKQVVYNTQFKLSDYEKELVQRILCYSKAWLVPFTAAMMAKLPRELRDDIYVHLLVQLEACDLTYRCSRNAYIYDVDFWDKWKEAGPRKFRCLHYDRLYYDTLPTDIVSGCLVDIAFYREFVQMHYHRSSFVLDEAPKNKKSLRRYNVSRLEYFLKLDPFEVGAICLSICRLELRFSQWTFTRTEELPIQGSVRDQLRTHFVTEWYKPLHRINSKCFVKFIFNTKHPSERESMSVETWRNYCMALIPTLKMLEERGCSVGFRVERYLMEDEPKEAQLWDLGNSPGQLLSQRLEDLITRFGPVPIEKIDEQLRQFYDNFEIYTGETGDMIKFLGERFMGTSQPTLWSR